MYSPNNIGLRLWCSTVLTRGEVCPPLQRRRYTETATGIEDAADSEEGKWGLGRGECDGGDVRRVKVTRQFQSIGECNSIISPIANGSKRKGEKTRVGG